jgi:hypothetical protein
MCSAAAVAACSSLVALSLCSDADELLPDEAVDEDEEEEEEEVVVAAVWLADELPDVELVEFDVAVDDEVDDRFYEKKKTFMKNINY